MKLFSFIVLLLAFLGNGHSSAIVSTIHVLQNIEQADKTSLEQAEVEQEIVPYYRPEKIDLEQSEEGLKTTPIFHFNFSRHRLTFYFSSRLRN